ncbi:hypothetical protein MP228_011269 [Amoeboaphelidium protococcarum]|nr:hypothetical protein MP228_011269 [Amoeboaphelidium protococcarum]
MSVLVESKSFDKVLLYAEVPVWRHVYALPYAMVVYPGLIYLQMNAPVMESISGHLEYFYILVGFAVTVNVLLYLCCHWSVYLNSVLCYARSMTVHSASHVYIQPLKNQMKTELVKLKSQRLYSSQKEQNLYFEYQKKKFIYNQDKKRFESVQYPVNGPLSSYTNFSGLNQQQVKQCRAEYGLNEFDIPMPTFQELFKEHAVAPFFVFQVFCVALWFMDEYWYYSLFTLAMLFVFESTVVFQRLRNLRELRSMTQPPIDINVYRDGEWSMIKSNFLMPGDLVSVERPADDDTALPCDLLLLRGRAVVNEALLTGESTPLVKEAVDVSSHQQSDVYFDINDEQFKSFVLFGGTKVLQTLHTEPQLNDQGNTMSDGEIPSSSKQDRIAAPPSNSNGCLAYVLRTGFATTQGKLVRTMIFSSERVTANNKESLFFILFLLIFAIGASYHVWITGLKDGRKKSKLILDCIMILTSVVPPELPMELSLAVNQSLMALSKKAIFCLEPFRIPFAGKIDVCCFDKTGTLTEEDLKLDGIAVLGDGDSKQILTPANAIPLQSQLALGSCHSLLQIDGKVVGDPLEQAVLSAIGWNISRDDDESVEIVSVHGKTNSSSSSGSKVDVIGRIKSVKKFPFASSLKRMGNVSQIVGNLPGIAVNKNQLLVSVKGAPEVMKSMFKDIKAEQYDKVYTRYALSGSRVLAVGYKWIECNLNAAKDLKREDVECDLQFAGFLVFTSPLKKDTSAAIKELRESMHRIIMITGDNPLTACYIAKKLKIVRKDVVILDCDADDPQSLQYRTSDGKVVQQFYSSQGGKDKNSTSVGDHTKLILQYDICCTGPALEQIHSLPIYKDMLVHKIWVYARTSPSQKEVILHRLKEQDYVTLMCGDGTNDVGALKSADVGVALLDGTAEDLEKIAKTMQLRRMQEMQAKQEELFKSWGRNIPDNVRSQQQRQVQNLIQSIDSPDDVPILKFGDASVAASFTSKIGSVMSICEILRQGRCTLVTTIQMYKILALNCLITAFTLSALYLDGIKYGDTQLTLQGFLLAGCFLFLSWAKPIERLSKKRPLANIFNLYIIGTVLGQFAVHAASLWYVVQQTKLLLPEDWKPDEEEKEFLPNLLNTSVYLISLSMQVSTFLVNYEGRPFRESLRENKPLYYSLLSLLGIAICGAAQVSVELNEWVQLVPMEKSFSEKLVYVILMDVTLCYGINYALEYLFSDNKSKRSLDLE